MIEITNMCTLGVILAHRVLEYQKWCPSILDTRGNRGVNSIVDNCYLPFIECDIALIYCNYTPLHLIGHLFN